MPRVTKRSAFTGTVDRMGWGAAVTDKRLFPGFVAPGQRLPRPPCPLCQAAVKLVVLWDPQQPSLAHLSLEASCFSLAGARHRRS